MKKLLTAVLATLVLVSGAFAATAITGGSATAQAIAPGEQDRPDRQEKGAILEEVLSELVADGVIDESQAEAIAEAIAAKRDELREQRREDDPGRFERGFRRGFRLGELLEDGVIDEAELAELPDDHPLKDPNGPAAKYLDDNELTSAELRLLRQELHEQRHADKGDAESGDAAPTSSVV